MSNPNYAHYVTFADAKGIRSTRLHLYKEIRTVDDVSDVANLLRFLGVKEPHVLAWSRLPGDDSHPTWPPRP
jgi:hypothetical protein